MKTNGKLRKSHLIVTQQDMINSTALKASSSFFFQFSKRSIFHRQFGTWTTIRAKKHMKFDKTGLQFSFLCKLCILFG